MPKEKKDIKPWKPPRMWEGETVYIIGGGPSLSDMNWDRYHNRHYIGCNDAYMLGDWVDVCIWGDYLWFQRYHWEDAIIKPEGGHKGLKQYPGIIVSNCWKKRDEISSITDRVKLMKRIAGGSRKKGSGFGAGDALAWYGNTGCAAVNLAALFGAKTIVLLGFDCDKGEKVNWHTNLKDPKRLPHVVDKFIKGFSKLNKDIHEYDSSIEVINANPDSNIKGFPKMKRSDAMKL